MATQTVYVELLDEGVDVWRPVEADGGNGGTYRLPVTKAGEERWRFPPGSLVRCEWRNLSDGRVLVAVDFAD
jgi:hypothetical protein